MNMFENQMNNVTDYSYINNSATADKSTLMKMKNLGDREAVETAAKEFTSVFIGQMLKVMRSSSYKSELGHGGQGEEVFQNMLDDEYSRQVAYNDAFGLSGLIADSIQRRNSIESVE